MKSLRFILSIAFLYAAIPLFSQTVSIINKKFVVNGNASCPIYFNGANTPWESWNDFGGSYSTTKWAQNMADLKANGINSTRIWFSCNGDGQPNVATDGTVSAPTAAFWTNCDHLFAQAQANGVYVMATLMSFDHTKTGNNKATNWRAMMSDTAKIRTYINNYLIPFVNRYKTNPYFFSVDICNEIEWIVEDGSNWQTTYPVIQRFVAMCAVAMHSSAVARTDGSKVLVTLGSAATKWNASKSRNGSYGTGWQTNSTGNKWNDAALQAVYNNTNAYLDYYSPHFYGWINEYYSNPFETSPTTFGMDDKACLVGEMPAKDPFPIPTSSTVKTNWDQTTAYNALKTLGWQGHYPWTSNITTNLTEEVGQLSDFGDDALTYKNANSALVVPTCAAVATCQKPNLGADQSLCGVTGGITLNSNITITTNKTFAWYRGTTLLTGSTGTLAGNTTAGTYYVVVDSASGNCIARDTIILSATIPTPTITGGGALCSPSTFTLNSGVSGSGLVFQWSLGGVAISGATASTLTNVRSPGLYRVDISATGCTTQNASTTITSSNPTPIDGCRGNSGALTLSISNATGTNYNWYTTATGTTLAAGSSTGVTTYTTPVISATTTYYVQDMNSVSATLGKVTQTGTPIWGINDFTTTDKKQLLKILQATTLQSVKVYVVTGGSTVVIRVRNAADDATVASKTFTNVSAGEQTLSNIAINLTAGDYVLDADGTTTQLNIEGWSANTNTYSYPYTVTGVAQLINSTSWNNVGYGPFYEIKFQSGTNCDRVSVIAKIDAACGTPNNPPTISITSPTTGTNFTPPASITINATAADIDGTISNVQFYNGTTLLGSDASSPYSYTWTGVVAGTYSITAVATDNSGSTTTSSAVNITVSNVIPNHTPPSCVITAPHSNAYFQAGTDVTINVYSSGAGGTYTASVISKVDFYNGTTLIGSDATGTSNTFSIVWSTVPAGTYTLTAKATDAAGAISTSAGVIFTVGTTAVTKRGLSPCKGKYVANIIPNSSVSTVRADYMTYWNGVTAENGCKWGSIESTRDSYNWTAADAAYNYAKTNNLIFRYHAIAWGSQYPTWLEALSTDTAAFRAEIIEYMDAIAARYPNAIDQFDVLNEQIGTHATGTPFFRDGLGGTGTTGYDWQIWLFTQARKKFPNAKLILNDYGLENDANAINIQLQLVKVLRDRGLIDGFGTQAHCFNVDQLSSTPSTLTTRLDLMANSGVPIYVTELDLNGGTTVSEATQLTSYTNLFPMYWNHPAVAGITLWGYVEGSTWKTGTGLLNSDGTERTCMAWLKTYMTGRTDVGYPYCPAAVCATPAPTVTSTITYCQNATATALTATGTSLKWYTVATGGSGSSTAPTPITTVVGTTIYYVSQTLNSCEGPRASITVTINAIPSAPTVTTPITYQQGATASALTATGTGLLWYTTPTGGTGSSTAPTPSTATIGTTNYYVSQTINGCESTRAQITVNVIVATLTQTISLVSGWNFISINVHPSDSSVQTIFGSTPISIIKNADGFWRNGQNPTLQSLTHLQAGKGYLVQMTSPATISVTGTAVNTSLFQFPTALGWNMIGCPYQSATNLTSIFTATNTNTVKDFNGYWIPNDALSTISTLAPGKGYYWMKK